MSILCTVNVCVYSTVQYTRTIVSCRVTCEVSLQLIADLKISIDSLMILVALGYISFIMNETSCVLIMGLKKVNILERTKNNKQILPIYFELQ